MALQWDDQHLQPQQKFIRRLMNTLPYLRHYTPQIFWELFDDVYSILKRTHLENFFHHINNLHPHIECTMEKVSNEELTFLDTLSKRNNGKISVLVYRKLPNTDQYTTRTLQFSPPNTLFVLINAGLMFAGLMFANFL